MAMLNVTLIAPLASNPAFLDPYRFRNLIRMVPDDKYQVQVNSFIYFISNSFVEFSKHAHRCSECDLVNVALQLLEDFCETLMFLQFRYQSFYKNFVRDRSIDFSKNRVFLCRQL